MVSAAFSMLSTGPPFCLLFSWGGELFVGSMIIAMKTSRESKKLNNEQFYRAVKEKQKYDQTLPDIYIPNPHPTPWEGEKLYRTVTDGTGPREKVCRKSLTQ